MKRIVKVVAAILQNDNEEILCTLRSPLMTTPNQWEFPGGKVEENEDLFPALEREIMEELGCQIKATEHFHEHLHEYEEVFVNLLTIKCRLMNGTPIAKEHSKLIWLKRENLLSLNWAPADIPSVEKLISENK